MNISRGISKQQAVEIQALLDMVGKEQIRFIDLADKVLNDDGDQRDGTGKQASELKEALIRTFREMFLLNEGLEQAGTELDVFGDVA